MKRASAICVAAVLAASLIGCGDDDDDGAAFDARPIADATVPDAGTSSEICGESGTGSSNGVDCAAFCAPIDGLECDGLLRQEVCTGVCDQLKVDCPGQFSNFVDCAGVVPEWACVGPNFIIAGECTADLDCPCMRPVLESCVGHIAGDDAPGANELGFPATTADCVDVNLPDPDACAVAAATAPLTVDSTTEIAGNDTAAAALLAFELDDSFIAANVVAVKLQLATGGLGSESESSGEVWEVAPFTRNDLFGTLPAKQGAAPIADPLIGVAACTVVEWTLPLAVEPSTTVYLGVFPRSSNGVDYFGIGGDFAPRLIVEVAPP
jgi:hypothetical protein